MNRLLCLCMGVLVGGSLAAAQVATVVAATKPAPTVLAAADAAAIHRATPGLIEANGLSLAAGLIALPGRSRMSAAESVSAGTIVYTDRETGADTAVQSLADGSARAYVIVNQASAPTQFRFNFNLPVGSRFVEMPATSGGAISLIDSNGSVLGTIKPAWARSADGLIVPTSYVIDGSSIVQTVSHHGARYPVVADPWISFGCCVWQAPGIYMVIHLSWSERLAVLAGTWGAAVVLTDFICTRIPLPWAGRLICGQAAGVIQAAIFYGVEQEAYRGFYCGIAIQVVLAGAIGHWYECPY